MDYSFFYIFWSFLIIRSAWKSLHLINLTLWSWNYGLVLQHWCVRMLVCLCVCMRGISLCFFELDDSSTQRPWIRQVLIGRISKFVPFIFTIVVMANSPTRAFFASSRNCCQVALIGIQHINAELKPSVVSVYQWETNIQCSVWLNIHAGH